MALITHCALAARAAYARVGAPLADALLYGNNRAEILREKGSGQLGQAPMGQVRRDLLITC